MERLSELVKGYKLEDIWNIDELGLLFKRLSDKGLIEKAKSKKGGKNSKVRLIAAFFVNATLDAGIIRGFKLKYRKFLIKYVISRVNENLRAPDITKAVDILKVIGRIKPA